jgi:UDP-N-acetylglucosamine 1-carboxyvinyltransferase
VGTYLVAAAATGGSLRVEGICPEVLGVVRDKLGQTGADLDEGEDWISLDMRGERPKAVDIVTEPFPGFPHRYAGPIHCIEYGGARDISCHGDRI